MFVCGCVCVCDPRSVLYALPQLISLYLRDSVWGWTQILQTSSYGMSWSKASIAAATPWHTRHTRLPALEKVRNPSGHTHTDTQIHTWWQATLQGSGCLSRSIWFSVSCPKTLQHVDRRNQVSNRQPWDQMVTHSTSWRDSCTLALHKAQNSPVNKNKWTRACLIGA